MLDVDMAHLISFNEELAHRLANEPAEIIPIVCLTVAVHSLMGFANFFLQSLKLP